MTDLAVINSTTPVELGVADEVIAGLKGRLTGLKADTHQGYVMVKSAISEVRTYRTGVEKARKELKKSALEWGKKVDFEARRVTDLLLEIETPLREEKTRIDGEAERLRKEKEEAERLAIEAKDRAERQAREAEEAAKREAERKEREADLSRIAEERKVLEAERKRLDAERREQQEALEKEHKKIAIEREAVETEKRAVEEKAHKEREAKEAFKRKAQEKEDQAQVTAAEKLRLALEKTEAERLLEERKPDRQKLNDFANTIESLKAPQLKTAWGKQVLAKICDLLQCAVDAVYEGKNNGNIT